MPVYTYRCNECEIEKDYLLKMEHDKPLCEKCKKEMVKLLQPSTIKYKGKGFYATEHSSYYRKNRTRRKGKGASPRWMPDCRSRRGCERTVRTTLEALKGRTPT